MTSPNGKIKRIGQHIRETRFAHARRILSRTREDGRSPYRNRKIFENLYIYLRDGAPCAAYDGLGLDIKGRRLNDFVGNIAWIRFLLRHLTEDGMESATPMQKLTLIGTCPILLLQDKFCFWSFMDRHGIPVVPILAHTVGGKLVKAEEALPRLRSHKRFFVKPVAANCGSKASSSSP